MNKKATYFEQLYPAEGRRFFGIQIVPKHVPIATGVLRVLLEILSLVVRFKRFEKGEHDGVEERCVGR